MGGKAKNRAHSASEATGTYLGATLTGKSRQRPAHRQHGDEAWRIEDHVCRVCFSRILSRLDDGQRVYRCSNCGIEAPGHAPSIVCACGLKLKNGRDLGVRCIINDAPSPEAPSEVVARQVVT